VDACLQWHERLSTDDKETVLTLVDVMASAHKGVPLRAWLHASLPPAPA
jgi:hypothetical protein